MAFDNITDQRHMQALRAASKGDDILAQILASENLRISYSNKIRTAAFDLNTRTIYIPYWNVSKIVRIGLRAHEVGHALFTPLSNIHETFNPKNIRARKLNSKTFHRYVNVVEDTRIEMLMARKYRGLIRIFNAMHLELAADGFYGFRFGDFSTEADLLEIQKKVDALAFIDRALLHFRLGANKFFTVNFLNDIERGFIDEMGNITTFEQVEDLAYRIYMYQKEQTSEESAQKKKDGKSQDKPQKNDPESNETESGEMGGSEEQSSDDSEESESGSGVSENSDSSGVDGEPESEETSPQDNFDEDGGKSGGEDEDESPQSEEGEQGDGTKGDAGNSKPDEDVSSENSDTDTKTDSNSSEDTDSNSSEAKNEDGMGGVLEEEYRKKMDEFATSQYKNNQFHSHTKSVSISSTLNKNASVSVKDFWKDFQ